MLANNDTIFLLCALFLELVAFVIMSDNDLDTFFRLEKHIEHAYCKQYACQYES